MNHGKKIWYLLLLEKGSWNIGNEEQYISKDRYPTNEVWSSEEGWQGSWHEIELQAIIVIVRFLMYEASRFRLLKGSG